MFVFVVRTAFKIAEKCLRTGDQVVQSVSWGKSARDLTLDTLLGPEDDMEYVSTTQPAAPPHPEHPQQ